MIWTGHTPEGQGAGQSMWTIAIKEYFLEEEEELDCLLSIVSCPSWPGTVSTLVFPVSLLFMFFFNSQTDYCLEDKLYSYLTPMAV